MSDNTDMHPASTDELVEVLSGTIRTSSQVYLRDFAARLAAEELVRRLETAGFVVMKRPPQKPHTAG